MRLNEAMLGALLPSKEGSVSVCLTDVKDTCGSSLKNNTEVAMACCKFFADCKTPTIHTPPDKRSYCGDSKDPGTYGYFTLIDSGSGIDTSTISFANTSCPGGASSFTGWRDSINIVDTFPTGEPRSVHIILPLWQFCPTAKQGTVFVCVEATDMVGNQSSHCDTLFVFCAPEGEHKFPDEKCANPEDSLGE